MNKLLFILAMLFAAHTAIAQTTNSSDPSAAKSRAEVKAEECASGAVGAKKHKGAGRAIDQGKRDIARFCQV